MRHFKILTTAFSILLFYSCNEKNEVEIIETSTIGKEVDQLLKSKGIDYQVNLISEYEGEVVFETGNAANGRLNDIDIDNLREEIFEIFLNNGAKITHSGQVNSPNGRTLACESWRLDLPGGGHAYYYECTGSYGTVHSISWWDADGNHLGWTDIR